MEHLKLFATRLNVPQLIRVCEELELWRELTFLYVAYDEYDNALGVMITHSPLAWEHVQVCGGQAERVRGGGRDGRRARKSTSRSLTHKLPPSPWPPPYPPCPQFKDVAVKVKAAETLYKGISFYLEEHPDLLNDLLKVRSYGAVVWLRWRRRNLMTPSLSGADLTRCLLRCRRRLVQVVEARVDHSRVVDILRRAAQLPLVKDYLLSVQKNNLLAVSACVQGRRLREVVWVEAGEMCVRQVDTSQCHCYPHTHSHPHPPRSLPPPLHTGERGGQRAADRGGRLCRAARLAHHLRQLRPARAGQQVRGRRLQAALRLGCAVLCCVCCGLCCGCCCAILGNHAAPTCCRRRSPHSLPLTPCFPSSPVCPCARAGWSGTSCWSSGASRR